MGALGDMLSLELEQPKMELDDPRHLLDERCGEPEPDPLWLTSRCPYELVVLKTSAAVNNPERDLGRIEINLGGDDQTASAHLADEARLLQAAG